MSLKSHFELMSRYNQWMNQNIYEAASQLDEQTLKQDRGAFFKSIIGTLNHIWVADIIWLKRFAQHPRQYSSLAYVLEVTQPRSLDQISYTDLPPFIKARQKLDEVIINWCEEIQEEHLAVALEYTNTKGKKYTKNFGHLIQHFFNHQTHHRGQITTLLNQNGVDVGVTDLLMLIPEHI